MPEEKLRKQEKKLLLLCKKENDVHFVPYKVHEDMDISRRDVSFLISSLRKKGYAFILPDQVGNFLKSRKPLKEKTRKLLNEIKLRDGVLVQPKTIVGEQDVHKESIPEYMYRFRKLGFVIMKEKEAARTLKGRYELTSAQAAVLNECVQDGGILVPKPGINQKLGMNSKNVQRALESLNKKGLKVRMTPTTEEKKLLKLCTEKDGTYIIPHVDMNKRGLRSRDNVEKLARSLIEKGYKIELLSD
jgi:biotin operon repressor